MGYSLKSLKEELVSKNMANDGLVGWGQKSSLVGGVVGALVNPMHVISMIENSKILVIPFNNKEIKYNECIFFDKTQLTNAKVSGILGKKLVLKTQDGKKVTLPITQGAGDVKKIISRLGF